MKHRILFILLCSFLWIHAFSAASEYKLKLLPGERPFRLTFADPHEIRMALSVQGESRINAYLGNYFSIFSLQTDNEEDWIYHFGFEGAGYFSLRQAESRFPLESTDGLLGLYFEGAGGPWQLQFRYTHISAHLSDGSTESAFPYSREWVSLRSGRLFFEESLHVYSGVHRLVNSVPDVPGWRLQAGGSYFYPWGNSKIAPFMAVDIQWKEEAPYNPSLSFQLGVALNNPPRAYRSFRFFYAFYTGADPRGQFRTRLLNAHSLGIEMQI